MRRSLVTVLIITIIGGFFRIYNIDKNPISLNVDEVSVGYNAYSILKTGKDEYGNFLPLSIRSLGDYKPPVYTYFIIPSISLFGLNEFSIRFPAALIGALSIPLIYLFILELTTNRKYAFAGAVLLAISSWHIYHSRFALETPLSIFFVMLGVLFLQKMIKNKGWVWPVLSALFFILSMYTYQTERLYTPLFLLVYCIFNKKIFLQTRKKETLAFFVTACFLIIPLIISIFWGEDKTRASMMLLGKDIDFTRNVLVKPQFYYDFFPLAISKIFSSESLLLFFYWLKRLLAYSNPLFWFFNGLNMTWKGTYGLGLIYLFELPLLIIGLFTVLKKKFPNRFLIFSWLLVGLIPASLTLGEPNPRRILILLPIITLLLAVGSVRLITEIKKIFSLKFQIIIWALFVLFISWNLIQAFLVFSVHFPRSTGEGFMEGNKEAISYILQNQDKYQEIVFDPVRGVEGPYIVSVPYLYYLFYSDYDPQKYQNELKREGENSFGFDKLTFRPIDWRYDRHKKGVLFIGSPWSLPAKDVKEEEIIKKIYLTNGNLILLLVTPK